MVKALIIGGGIGGLSAAIALRRAGIDVTVFERAGELLYSGAGITLWSNAIRALSVMGVAKQVVQAGIPIEIAQIRSWRGKVLAVSKVQALSENLGAPSIGVHRGELQRVLYGALDQQAVCLGKECIGIFQYGDHVTASFTDRSQVDGDVLIGADGLNSVVRQELFGPSKPRYSGYTAWRGVTDFYDDGFRLGISGESWGRGARFGWLYINEKRVYWYATANTKEGAKDAKSGRRAELLKRFKGWHEPIEALIDSTIDTAILRNDIYDRKPLNRWSVGRVTLLGDAAHPMTPNLGQGACQAVEDAVALGESLKDSEDVIGALRDYERKRIGRTAYIVKQSRLIGSVAQWENPVGCWLRDMAIKMTPHQITERRLESLIAQ